MKIRTLLFTLAALVLTACGSGNQQKGQDITTINGNISDSDITQARIVLVSEKIDTVLDVTEGKFAFDVPVAK